MFPVRRINGNALIDVYISFTSRYRAKYSHRSNPFAQYLSLQTTGCAYIAFPADQITATAVSGFR
jgi:hypothetical protein